MSLSRAQRVARYGGRAPRYTSYPTANQFEPLGPDALVDALPEIEPTISVYAHIPYCTKLCWYCGCNTTIRRDRTVGDALVDDLLAELHLLAPHVKGVKMGQLALGGGTPNFLKNGPLRRMVRGIEEVFGPTEEVVRSTELDPRTVEPEQLNTLTELGFRKFSLGVQTLHPEVQQVVNRPLPPGRLWSITDALRKCGTSSLNLDLMVGLPRQTPATMDCTLETVLAIRPERLAVFQYAHMPNLRPAQLLLARHGLPGPEERDELYRHVVARLVEAGYERVGFDHFALPDDPLAVAMRHGKLERNFQGFTDDPLRDLIALGPSSIGRVGRLYYQNHRDVEPWQEAIAAGTLPVVRGLLSTDEDELLAGVIKDIMCRNSTDLTVLGAIRPAVEERLKPLLQDGLVRLDDDVLHVTGEGFDFIRSVAAVFDERLDRSAHSSVA